MVLKVSINMKTELTVIFGFTKYHKIFLPNDFNGDIVCNWKIE